MPSKLQVALCALALAATAGCHRITHAIADDENPETVFLTPTELGGDASHFEETVVVYTSLRGLISWNEPNPREVLAKYYNTGKVQNLVIHQGQSAVEGLITLIAGAGFLVEMRHVTYEGDVIRRF